MNELSKTRHRYRSIWISDIHLGTRGCQAEMLLDFLKNTESKYLYLVGDIIDGWRMKRAWYWRQAHNDVIQKLLRKARKGTRVIYIPGNHDEKFRDFTNHRFGRVAVLYETVHTMADGRRFLVLHGDRFDGVIIYAKWLAFLGDHAYNAAIAINLWFNIARRTFGLPYWSLSAFLKHKVKNAVEYISKFEDAVVEEARHRGTDGVICGHIHSAEIRDIDGITYCNDGDWVESCTALVEHEDGRLEILHWAELQGLTPLGKDTCESSSSATPGFLKSMASSVRSIL
ncbi:MAG: UDP-2,3-diacylglucosamine diphosphatase [Rhodospirillales bacterium]|nr:UDP-2,3-diacylglucosamine diphosphatase [Rhodospirillales bacterium]